MLTARLLTQRNDRISIQRIAESFDSLSHNDPRWRAVNAARIKLNDYLDQPALFGDSEGASSSNREILDTFLYGFYAHTRETHELSLEKWFQIPKTFFPFKLLFLMALQALYETAVEIKLQIEPSQRHNTTTA